MKYLKQYIEQKNVWNRITNSPLLDAETLNTAQVRDIQESLECDLSPENLCCDGELRGAKLRTKEKMLTGAKRELEEIYG